MKCANCGKENLVALEDGYNIEVGFFLCDDCNTKYKNGDEGINKKFNKFLESKPELKAGAEKRKNLQIKEEKQRTRHKYCPYCGKEAPTFRMPTNLRQALLGGWTCESCGKEFDKWGKKIETKEQKLKPGESIEKGFCPKCGDVAVKITGRGYNPSCLGVIFHLLLTLVTVGGWIPFWIGWAIGCHLRRGRKTCMKCGQLLQEG